MMGIKKIIGIGLGILISIGAIVGICKRRKRKIKTVNEIERDIQELNEEIMELNEEELDKVIEEMTAALAKIDRWMGIDDIYIKDDDLEINRVGDQAFYYGYVHGGPYGGIDYKNREEKLKRWNQLMNMLMNRATIKKIGP